MLFISDRFPEGSPAPFGTAVVVYVWWEESYTGNAEFERNVGVASSVEEAKYQLACYVTPQWAADEEGVTKEAYVERMGVENILEDMTGDHSWYEIHEATVDGEASYPQRTRYQDENPGRW